jgi:uncharacterized protein (TIGR02145 family)
MPYLFILLFLAIAVYGQQERIAIIQTVDDGDSIKFSDSDEPQGNTLTDSRDGKKYKTAKIGTQTWMAENLDYAAKDSKCYENNALYCDKYGRLYDWSTARVVCPKGWHLPSKEEWQTLVSFAGGEEIAGKKLKAKRDWNSIERKSGNGTDDYGFAALPGGVGSDGDFGNVGYYGYWWSSTKYDANYAGFRYMGRYMGYSENVYWNDVSKYSLFSVRCLQD